MLIIYVRTVGGAVAHRAYEQGPTFCGLRKHRRCEGKPTRFCDKCGRNQETLRVVRGGGSAPLYGRNTIHHSIPVYLGAVGTILR